MACLELITKAMENPRVPVVTLKSSMTLSTTALISSNPFAVSYLIFRRPGEQNFLGYNALN